MHLQTCICTFFKLYCIFKMEHFQKRFGHVVRLHFLFFFLVKCTLLTRTFLRAHSARAEPLEMPQQTDSSYLVKSSEYVRRLSWNFVNVAT